jgi:hypothetical protein
MRRATRHRRTPIAAHLPVGGHYVHPFPRVLQYRSPCAVDPMSGWHRHRDRAGTLIPDKTREEQGLLPGQNGDSVLATSGNFSWPRTTKSSRFGRRSWCAAAAYIDRYGSATGLAVRLPSPGIYLAGITRHPVLGILAGHRREGW